MCDCLYVFIFIYLLLGAICAFLVQKVTRILPEFAKCNFCTPREAVGIFWGQIRRILKLLFIFSEHCETQILLCVHFTQSIVKNV